VSYETIIIFIIVVVIVIVIVIIIIIIIIIIITIMDVTARFYKIIYNISRNVVCEMFLLKTKTIEVGSFVGFVFCITRDA